METSQTPNGAPPADIEMKTEPMTEPDPTSTTAETATLHPPAVETPTLTPQPTTPSHNQTPAPARVPTPSNSAQRSTPATQVPPEKPNPHGSPTRVYLNQNVTPYLLEGMKQLAVLEPEKPLAWLAGFLEGKSREVEGP